jgi:glycogen synthase
MINKDSPAGNGGQRLFLTAAVCGATDWQLVLAAAYYKRRTLHSRRETQQTIKRLNNQQFNNE